MHKVYTVIYIIAWFLAPVIFFLVFVTKGELCLMYTCSGNDEVGLVYAFVSVAVYFIILKLVSYVARGKNFWSLSKIHFGFLYLLVILAILISYFLGKMNSKVIYFDPTTSSSYEILDVSS